MHYLLPNNYRQLQTMQEKIVHTCLQGTEEENLVFHELLKRQQRKPQRKCMNIAEDGVHLPLTRWYGTDTFSNI